MLPPDIPEPPGEGAPCNGCGMCCVLALCPLAAMAKAKGPPCEHLLWHKVERRFRCEMVVVADEVGGETAVVVRKALGIGNGCLS